MAGASASTAASTAGKQTAEIYRVIRSVVICLQQEFDVGGAGHSPVERKRIMVTINFNAA